ncbi:MAG: hypothetical protein ABI415_03060 [Flavitalea sp.]
MKKANSESQTLDLNRIDFERAGSGRKAGYKFLIEFVQGRVSNVISGSPLASDLAVVLLQDPASRAILTNSDINISLNTKFQLSIVNTNPSEQKKEDLQLQETANDTPPTTEEKEA